MSEKGVLLTRERMLELLDALNGALTERGIRGELCLFGGAALILGWNSREITRDIDATFVPASEIRKIVSDLAEELGLPEGWLNDGVKGFLSSRGRPRQNRKPFLTLTNLVVYIPAPSYLLAMKAMAARTTEEQSDREDLEFLLREMKISDVSHVMEIVLQYFPEEQVTPKTQYFVESVLDEMSRNPGVFVEQP